MSDLHRYLVEEVALDYKDGILTRTEAQRRLVLLGVAGAAASAMLAACSSERSQTEPTEPPSSTTSAPTTTGTATMPTASASASAEPTPKADPGPETTEPITFAGPEGRRLQARWASAPKPKGAVLVIHENKGLTDHFKGFPSRFAKEGYASLAIDLLSAEGGTDALGDPGNATAALGKISPERFVADIKAGLDEMAKRAPKVKMGVIGFCFGGGMSWRMVAAKDPRIAAAAPFYGPFPEGADVTGSKAAVLGVYAELDARVNASREVAEAALTKAKLVHEIVTYPGVDHAFFNETGKRYNAEATAKAWAKVLEWFGKHLA